ncbi:hypothetical protein RJ639_031246 [Escallonia herrerae]|uniref:VWFA domain-containing protein n=1 Tax=Escallonia herrerae TaxID=1293975 RepID=A0AA88X0E0_9ASTE|nr:hypothetical protein RJ639_031246 [Escallonia herrerae]
MARVIHLRIEDFQVGSRRSNMSRQTSESFHAVASIQAKATWPRTSTIYHVARTPCGHLFLDDEPLPAAVPIGDSTPSIKPLPSLTVKAFPELPALAASDSISKFAALVGVQAPPLVDDSKRAPIDLVAVLDVNGSMTGSKIALLKRAVEFVIQNLGPSDRLSIVTFSTGAQRIFPLRRMNDRGREDAVIAIKSLSASGSTNIVEGLKKGVRVLKECLVQNPVRSIMFLSDGMDTYNHNHLYIKKYLPLSICPKPGNGEAAATAPIVVHSFGFGSDHDAATLHAISDASGGTFSFVESNEIVQDAFVKCISGLLRRKGVIDIGDLYADEEKDFLVYLAVPPTPDSEAGEETNTLLMDVHGERVEIRRPEILSPDNMIIRLEVDRQRNRLSLAEGIAEAQAMADREDVAGDELCNWLESELVEIRERVESMELYEQAGRAYAYAGMSSHARQRRTTLGVVRDCGTQSRLVKTCLKESIRSRLVQDRLKESIRSRLVQDRLKKSA